jgi:hypothetical protein
MGVCVVTCLVLGDGCVQGLPWGELGRSGGDGEGGVDSSYVRPQQRTQFTSQLCRPGPAVGDRTCFALHPAPGVAATLACGRLPGLCCFLFGWLKKASCHVPQAGLELVIVLPHPLSAEITAMPYCTWLCLQMGLTCPFFLHLVLSLGHWSLDSDSTSFHDGLIWRPPPQFQLQGPYFQVRWTPGKGAH